jgi:hypothetical protein
VTVVVRRLGFGDDPADTEALQRVAVTLFDIDIEHCPDCSGASDDHPFPSALRPS